MWCSISSMGWHRRPPPARVTWRRSQSTDSCGQSQRYRSTPFRWYFWSALWPPCIRRRHDKAPARRPCRIDCRAYLARLRATHRNELEKQASQSRTRAAAAPDGRRRGSRPHEGTGNDPGAVQAVARSEQPLCPKCGSRMVERIARKGRMGLRDISALSCDFVRKRYNVDRLRRC